MAAIASRKGRDQISNSRVSREISKLANNSGEVLPEGCKYAKCVQKDGDQNGEQFIIAISPSVFDGSEPVELMFSYHMIIFRFGLRKLLLIAAWNSSVKLYSSILWQIQNTFCKRATYKKLNGHPQYRSQILLKTF